LAKETVRCARVVTQSTQSRPGLTRVFLSRRTWGLQSRTVGPLTPGNMDILAGPPENRASLTSADIPFWFISPLQAPREQIYSTSSECRSWIDLASDMAARPRAAAPKPRPGPRIIPFTLRRIWQILKGAFVSRRHFSFFPPSPPSALRNPRVLRAIGRQAPRYLHTALPFSRRWPTCPRPKPAAEKALPHSKVGPAPT